MTDTITFHLPIPPSANKQKTHGKVGGKPRLIQSKEYAVWLRHAGLMLNTQTGFDCTHPFLWSTCIEHPCNFTRLDIDNPLKAIFDALNKAGKLPDDRHQCDMRTTWARTERFVIHATKEPLEKWQEVKDFSDHTLKLLRPAYL